MSKPTETTPFLHTRRILFGDVDSAGIVFTPRISYFATEAIEAWYLNRLGIDWHLINNFDKIGTPFVRMELDFKSRMSPPDVIETRVLLEKLGRSSLTFKITSRIQDTGRLCWEARATTVFVSNETYASIPVPPPYLAAVQNEATIAARLLAEES